MKLLCIDCEGPLTLNDNAYELCQHFLPQGDSFFKLISSFDDYLAEVTKKEGYTAGGTLKLIVPFLKAHGATNQHIKEFSRKSLKVVPGAKHMLQNAASFMQVFIISTSYTPYIKAFCESISFPVENTYSTFLDLDRHPLCEQEKNRLISIYQQINTLHLPAPEGEKDISAREKQVIDKLEKIFFKEIPSMDCKLLMDETRPVGGEEKKRAVEQISGKVNLDPDCMSYVGDSVTDKQALRFVREKGGLSVCFNGNIYALKEADFACISPHTYPIFVALKEFTEKGKQAVEKITSGWPASLEDSIKKSLSSFAPESVFAKIKKDNFSYLVHISQKMREQMRGKTVGELG